MFPDCHIFFKHLIIFFQRLVNRNLFSYFECNAYCCCVCFPTTLFFVILLIEQLNYTVTFEEEGWSSILELKLTDLKFICRDHGFTCTNKFSDETKEEKRKVLLNSLKFHLQEVHQWNFETHI